MLQISGDLLDMRAAIHKSLAGSLRADQLISSQDILQRYSTDFSEQAGPAACLIVRPESREQVSACLLAAADARCSVTVRGGGMSYTLGYVPASAATVILDMSAMNRIIEINTNDLYVMVEAGVTWKQLANALKGSGYHIPFGGTLSGERATIGGGLGNGAAGIKKGEITDHVMGLEVVLADGRTITTGCLATGDPLQPMRHYGPDFSGAFIHDAGTLGIKTRAAFRLHRAPGGIAYACAGFNDTDDMIDAMCDIGRTGYASEVISFGQYHNNMFASEPAPDFQALKSMARATIDSSPGKRQGCFHLLQMLRPGGLRFLKDWKHVLIVIAEGDTWLNARYRIRQLRKIVRAGNGSFLPPGLAIALRSDPFQPVGRLINGWQEQNISFPSNRVVRYSDAHELSRLAGTFWQENAEVLARHNLVVTELYLIVNATFGIEPIIYWRDSMNPLRLSIVDPVLRNRAAEIPADTEARAAAIELRQRLVERLGSLQGAHYQIGKYYPYQRDLKGDDNRRFLAGFKQAVDPGNLLNPGGLGIDV